MPKYAIAIQLVEQYIHRVATSKQFMSNKQFSRHCYMKYTAEDILGILKMEALRAEVFGAGFTTNSPYVLLLEYETMARKHFHLAKTATTKYVFRSICNTAYEILNLYLEVENDEME